MQYFEHFLGNLNFQSCYHLLLGKPGSIFIGSTCSSLICSWIINKQWIFLGWIGSVPPHFHHSKTTTRYCETGSQKSSCTRSENPLGPQAEICYCNEDLCNTGNWNKELSYLLMGFIIGFQILINCLVVWKYIALSKAWF